MASGETDRHDVKYSCDAVRMISVFLPQIVPGYIPGPDFRRNAFQIVCLPPRRPSSAAMHAPPKGQRAMFAEVKSDRSRYECGEGSAKSAAQRMRSLYLDFAGEAAEFAGIAAGKYLARMDASRISTALSGSRFQTSSRPKIEIPK